MLDFAAIQNAIRTWVTATVQVPCVWENDPRPMLGKFPVHCRLTEPTSIKAVGQDYNLIPATGNDVTPTLTGIREFTVTVRLHGRSQTPNKSSRYYAERLRTSLKKPTILEHFRANEIAIVRATDVVNYDAPFDGRFEPISAFDVRFTCAISPVADDTQDTIGTIEVSSDFTGPDGASLPSPPNVTNEQIPIDP